MKKFIAIAVCAMLCTVLAVTSIAANTVNIDFTTEEGQAMGEFFGEGCSYQEDVNVGMVAYLENKNDGADATEDNGGLYNNGIAVKFNSEAAGKATITVTYACPDQPYGASGYTLAYSVNGADYETEALGEASGSFADHEFEIQVSAGENTVKFVQLVGGGTNGNGWRIDLSSISIALPDADEQQGGDDTPATDAPATDAPATDAPATDAPATDAPDQPETNPHTADASVIAAAAAACVALAGVVIAKKSR